MRAFPGLQQHYGNTKIKCPAYFVLCVNTITDHYDEEKISDLPLPPAMKKQILDIYSHLRDRSLMLFWMSIPFGCVLLMNN